MPAVLPVTEMQRNSASLVDTAMQTKEPIYLTRHGKAAVVVIDAAEFDSRMAFRDALLERERRVYEGVLRGEAEIASGNGIALEDALAQLDEAWSG